MWFCHNKGMISAVQHRDDPETLIVRSRRKEWLADLFPGEKIHTSAGSDYKYRIFIDRRLFAETVRYWIMNDLKYDNFKNSVEDDELYDMYSEIWSVAKGYQV